MEEAIKAQFQIIRVQTMADGAVRVVLEASEKRTDLLQIFADVRRAGGLLETAMLPVLPDKQSETDDKISTRSKRKSEWKAPEE